MKYHSCPKQVKILKEKTPWLYNGGANRTMSGMEPSNQGVIVMLHGGSLFSQALSLIDRHLFHKAVLEHKTECASKGFSSRAQFVSLLFS